MSNELVKLNFQGDDVLLVDVGGKPHVVLRPALEAIGLDAKSQMEKLQKRSWATLGSAPAVASDGKRREMMTCDVRTFLMLLGSIDENLVSPNSSPSITSG